MSDFHFDWSDIVFGSKKEINQLDATFIAAPREISKTRLAQLVKQYLPIGNIIVGIADEEYILGFEGQPQFKTLQLVSVEPTVKKVNAAKFDHNIYTLSYAQRDIKFILEKLTFKKVLLINGSWKHMFHTLPAYHVLNTKKTDYELVSPFASEKEAVEYAAAVFPLESNVKGVFSVPEMLKIAQDASKNSFDYCFQTGVSLGRKAGNKYEYLASGFNKVVPYQTYAMHHGSLREINFSPINDLNHYDTIHAEVDLMLKAGRQKLSLAGTTLFINLLPCPSCARMFCETEIGEFIYQIDHSDGYAVSLLEIAGKRVTRVVQ